MLLAKHLIWEQALDFINTSKISGELLHEIMNSHLKITSYLHMLKDLCCHGYIMNHTYCSQNILKGNCLVLHWCFHCT